MTAASWAVLDAVTEWQDTSPSLSNPRQVKFHNISYANDVGRCVLGGTSLLCDAG